MSAQREQVELRACDLDSLLAPDHPARRCGHSCNRCSSRRCTRASRPCKAVPDAPRSTRRSWWRCGCGRRDGVGSAREIDRLCERDNAYRWLCGGVGVNYHTLADFRTEHEAWLDAQLTHSIAALLDRKLVTLNVVAQDGLRVRASAKAASFRRKAGCGVDGAGPDPGTGAEGRTRCRRGASSRRKRAAQERAAREREQRLHKRWRRWTRSTRHVRRRRPPLPRTNRPRAPRLAAKAEPEPRVSSTDPEARVMKMADGGFRPAFNAQLAVDAATQLIAAVEVVNRAAT